MGLVVEHGCNPIGHLGVGEELVVGEAALNELCERVLCVLVSVSNRGNEPLCFPLPSLLNVFPMDVCDGIALIDPGDRYGVACRQYVDHVSGVLRFGLHVGLLWSGVKMYYDNGVNR